jgi:hypothetical protein
LWFVLLLILESSPMGGWDFQLRPTGLLAALILTALNRLAQSESLGDL